MVSNLFHEIVKSYEISISSIPKYSKSKHWQKYFDNDFRQLISEDNLKFFRKNGLSDGLDNRRLENLEYLELEFNSFLNYLKKYKINFGKIQNLFPNMNTGQLPIFLTKNNHFIDTKFISTIKYYLLFEKLIFNKNCISANNIHILDIGGGFGALISVLIRSDFLRTKKVKYFLIDLPETNLLSNYYLGKQFPEKRILNMNTKNLTKEILSINDLNNFDIFILPTNSNISDEIRFDFINNTASMMEMNFEQIKKYFNFIQSRIKLGGYFSNINRYYKDSVGEKIYLHNYPYDDNWTICHSVSHGRRSHFLITKRVNSKTPEIQKEMRKIKLISKLHSPPSMIPIQIYNIYRKLKKKLKKSN